MKLSLFDHGHFWLMTSVIKLYIIFLIRTSYIEKSSYIYIYIYMPSIVIARQLPLSKLEACISEICLKCIRAQMDPILCLKSTSTRLIETITHPLRLTEIARVSRSFWNAISKCIHRALILVKFDLTICLLHILRVHQYKGAESFSPESITKLRILELFPHFQEPSDALIKLNIPAANMWTQLSYLFLPRYSNKDSLAPFKQTELSLKTSVIKHFTAYWVNQWLVDPGPDSNRVLCRVMWDLIWLNPVDLKKYLWLMMNIVWS
jgi:hypothetical protein